MIKKKHHPWLFALNILIFAAVIFLHTSEIADISIKSATPMLILPLITAYSIFSDLKGCVISGLICGAFLDSVSHGAYCFNTLTLMFLSLFVYFMASNLFNKNCSFFLKYDPATSYFPGRSPSKYSHRYQSLLSCSGWERVVS